MQQQPIPETPEKPIQMTPVQPTQGAYAPQYFTQPQHAIPVVGAVAPGYAQSGPVNPHISLWSTPFCSCMDDVNSLVESVFCIRCQLSRQYNVITYNTNTIEPWTFLGPLAVDVFLGVPLAGVFFTWYMRNRIRARYQIAGDDLNDCLAATFLPWCTVSQSYREMSLRGEWSGGCCIQHPYSFLPPPPAHMDNQVSAQPVQ